MKIIIDNHNLLGDIVVFLPALISLRKEFPRAEFHMLVAGKTEKLICENAVNIDKFYFMNVDSISRTDFFKLIILLRKEKYDLGISSTTINPLKSKVFFNLIGCKKTVGISNGLLKNDYDIYTQITNNEVINNLCILEALGKKVNTVPVPVLMAEDTDIEIVKKRINYSSDDIVVGLCIGTGDFIYKKGKKRFTYNCKQWPIENYFKLKDLLISYKNNIKVVFIGGAKERKMLEECGIIIKENSNNINLIDKIPITQTLGLLSICSFVIGGDTGIMHCAAGLDVNTISIFGATNEAVASPYSAKNTVIVNDISCRPCIKTYGVPYDAPAGVCDHKRCINDITVNQVFNEFIRRL